MNMKDLNGMDKFLHETCTWNYLGKWYMVIIWAWQEDGGTVILGSCKIFMFYNKFDCKKMTRHGANMGEIDGGNWESVSWVPLPMYKILKVHLEGGEWCKANLMTNDADLKINCNTLGVTKECSRIFGEGL